MKVKKSEILEDYCFVASILTYCTDGYYYKDFKELANKYGIEYEYNEEMNGKHNVWCLGDELLCAMSNGLIEEDVEVEV